MHPRLVRSPIAALMLAGLCLVDAPPALAQTVTRAPSRQGFGLLPRAAAVFDVNRVICPIEATGEICGSLFDHTIVFHGGNTTSAIDHRDN